MAVISITIEESLVQKVDGIPLSITLSTNVPATIFYTLDGTEPTTSSLVYIEPIPLPTDENTVVFKAFATDGDDTCPVITTEYGSNTTIIRRSHDEVTGLNDVNQGATFPFGSQDPGTDGVYGNGSRLLTVDRPDIAGESDNFDGTGTGTYANETDQPLEDYKFIFSESNAIGERGAGIGTLPAEVTFTIPDPVQELSVADGSNRAGDLMFNPKSLVIFQDGSEEPFDENVQVINRSSFSLEDPEVTRSGALYHTTALEGNVNQGSALVQRFNPRDNTITYYYFDSRVSRWIISKEPFSPKNPNIANYSKMVFGREKGPGKVFKWLPFRYRSLTI